MDKNTNVQLEIIKLLEGKTKRHHRNISGSNDFIQVYKSQDSKSRNRQVRAHETKSYFIAEEKLNRKKNKICKNIFKLLLQQEVNIQRE